jgi:hypothetical protein
MQYITDDAGMATRRKSDAINTLISAGLKKGRKKPALFRMSLCVLLKNDFSNLTPLLHQHELHCLHKFACFDSAEIHTRSHEPVMFIGAIPDTLEATRLLLGVH